MVIALSLLESKPKHQPPSTTEHQHHGVLQTEQAHGHQSFSWGLNCLCEELLTGLITLNQKRWFSGSALLSWRSSSLWCWKSDKASTGLQAQGGTCAIGCGDILSVIDSPGALCLSEATRLCFLDALSFRGRYKAINKVISILFWGSEVICSYSFTFLMFSLQL